MVGWWSEADGRRRWSEEPPKLGGCRRARTHGDRSWAPSGRRWGRVRVLDELIHRAALAPSNRLGRVAERVGNGTEALRGAAVEPEAAGQDVACFGLESVEQAVQPAVVARRRRVPLVLVHTAG